MSIADDAVARIISGIIYYDGKEKELQYKINEFPKHKNNATQSEIDFIFGTLKVKYFTLIPKDGTNWTCILYDADIKELFRFNYTID